MTNSETSSDLALTIAETNAERTLKEAVSSTNKAARRKKTAGKGKGKASQSRSAAAAPKSAARKGKRKNPAGPKDVANALGSESKAAKVIEAMKRSKGATLAEIMEATGWQAHTVRGFVSGTLTKKPALNVESFRSESGERTYRITP